MLAARDEEDCVAPPPTAFGGRLAMEVHGTQKYSRYFAGRDLRSRSVLRVQVRCCEIWAPLTLRR